MLMHWMISKHQDDAHLFMEDIPSQLPFQIWWCQNIQYMVSIYTNKIKNTECHHCRKEHITLSALQTSWTLLPNQAATFCWHLSCCWGPFRVPAMPFDVPSPVLEQRNLPTRPNAKVQRWRSNNGHMLIGLKCQVIPSPSNNSATTVIVLFSIDLLIPKVHIQTHESFTPTYIM